MTPSDHDHRHPAHHAAGCGPSHRIIDRHHAAHALPAGRQWNALRRGVVRFVRRPLVRRIFWGCDAHFRGRRGRHRRPVVASLQRPDRTRCRDAVAEGGDREEFRRQTNRVGRRHPDRARRERPHILTLARHRRARRRRHRGRDRAESRSRHFRHGPADRQCARGKPQSGRRRNVGADRDRRPASPCSPAPTSGRSPPRPPALPAAQSRPAGRISPCRRDRCAPARRTSPASSAWIDGLRRDRPRRSRSARARSQERQSDRRRPAQRQALDVQPDQCEPDAAAAGRRDFRLASDNPDGHGC